jgi:hypothetical protein
MIHAAVECSNVSSIVRQRDDLKYLEGIEVSVSGRLKEYRKHEKRRDLDTLLLTNLIVNPLPFGESIAIHHMWFLRRQFKKMGRIPEQGERVRFVGVIQSYRRLGGRSLDRGMFNTTDFGIKPLHYED